SPSNGQKRASPLKCCRHVGQRRTASIVGRSASAVFGDPARPCGAVTVHGVAAWVPQLEQNFATPSSAPHDVQKRRAASAPPHSWQNLPAGTWAWHLGQVTLPAPAAGACGGTTGCAGVLFCIHPPIAMPMAACAPMPATPPSPIPLAIPCPAPIIALP